MDGRSRLEVKYGVDIKDQATLRGAPGLLVFPNTPTVNQGGTASYSEYDVTHSNYSFPAYQKSQPEDISIDALFTADTMTMAALMWTARKFCQVATKMDFNGTGAPPPVLKFNYLGPHAFSNVPCVMIAWNMSYNNDIDYVKYNNDWLPIEANFTITVKPVYSPAKQAREWSFGGMRSGNLIRRGYL